MPNPIITDPDWLPHTFDLKGENLTFVHVPLADRADLIFLSDHYYQGRFPKIQQGLENVRAEVDPAATPLHFIYHTSFCCSTLLVKALDIPGTSMTLREPDILINLANRFIQAEDSRNQERLDLVLRLLARPYSSARSVIVKPTNFANRLIVPTLRARPETKAILLYSDLPTLLRSLVKKGMWGRIWGRQLYAHDAKWSNLNFGYSETETFQLTDLQVAGLAWLMQIHHFDQVARTFGPSRIFLIDSADFIRDTAGMLFKAASFLSVPLSEEESLAISEGPVFSHHSKLSQQDYSVEARSLEHSNVMAAHGEEIDMVVKWVEAVGAHCQAPMEPGFPL